MKNDSEQREQAAAAELSLRERAEAKLQRDSAGVPERAGRPTLGATQEQLYELRLHQLELEMQNEELRRIQLELANERTRYRDLYNFAPVGYCTLSETEVIQELNLTFAVMLGASRAGLLNTPILHYVFSEDADRYYLSRRQLYETGEPQELDVRLLKTDGAPFWCHLKFVLTDIGSGGLIYYVTFDDISGRKAAEEKYLALFNDIPDALFIADPLSRKLVDCNRAAELLTGYSRVELLMMKAEELHPSDRLEMTMPPGFQQHAAGAQILVETEIMTKAGRRIPVEISASTFSVGTSRYMQGIFRDISERVRRDAEIKYLSFHDVLTGLYNRRYFEEELQRLDTARQLPISIIVCDINGLKLTNDVFGHAAGDSLLQAAAQYFRAGCRAEDVTVRYGGDEFTVLLPQCDAATASDIVARIQGLAREKTIEGLPVSLALGAATKIVADENIYLVINRAETQMYWNKSQTANQVRLEMLEALERQVYVKDYKEEHATRMRELASQFAEYLQLSNELIADIQTLANVHDIGKVAIDDAILDKTGALDDREWQIVKGHPLTGNRILRITRMVSFAVEEAVLGHHEHWDGGGYPNGLAGTAIPFLSRLIAIIDAYDVMTNDRPYHSALAPAAAIAELSRAAGTQFDPELVLKFVEFIGNRVVN